MAESTQHKLTRVRRPRVHITYDVETEGATVKKELPFVVGVIGDYSGNAPGEGLKPLKERKFTFVDRDNFNDVMRTMKPGLNIRVENTLKGEGEMGVQLKFNSMADFEPARVAEQVEPLKKLMEARERLQALSSSVDRSDELEGILEDVLKNTEALQKMSSDAGVGADGGGDEGGGGDESKDAE